MRTDVLLISAFHPELAPLRAVLGDALTGQIGAATVLAKAVGIGVPNAAVGLASRIEAIAPRACVFVGTCGAYPEASHPLDSVVVSRRIRLVDPAVIEGRAAFPDPMSTVLDANAPLVSAIAAHGARPVDVATTLAITTDDALAERIAQATGCEAEHLEAHAVATACAAFGVPFAAILGVANVVGARARDEWRTHHRSASEAAARVAVAWLQSFRM
jgi:nucleoside phosphorylase